ncbi:MAG: thiolase family protein [Chloroflexota bacterium]
MKNAVIVSAARTPIGNFGGSLRDIPAYDLASLVIKEAIKRANLSPEMADMVILGQNYQSGEYVNIARQSLLKAGWPVSIPALTIDRRCPSGFDAVCLGAAMIKSESARVIVAGGVESMSTAEFYVKGEVRWGLGGQGDMPRGQGSLSTSGIPLYDRILRARAMSQPEARFGVIPTMMTWAETAATEYNLSREAVDRWALLSHERACDAIKSRRFKDEIVPVPVTRAEDKPFLFTQDEHPRPDTSLKALARLKPVLGGVCTAGNSAGQGDGAAAAVVMSEDKAKELGTKPMAYLRAFAMSGVDPRQTWTALPVAVNEVLKKAGLELRHIDLIEIHEAFAAQVLANLKDLGLSRRNYDRINVNGSCIALGHPLGATGARILTTLLYEMARRQVRYGLLAMCGGGGMGVAGILERA